MEVAKIYRLEKRICDHRTILFTLFFLKVLASNEDLIKSSINP